jgi:hypothetical protein
MGTLRTLATVGVACFACVIANLAPATAREDCNFIFCLPPAAADANADAKAKAPLSIAPDAKQTRKLKRKARADRRSVAAKANGTTAAKQGVRTIIAKNRTATRASRAAARRQAAATRDIDAQAESDNVMRGRDTVSLIAMLPWWRNDPMYTIRFGTELAESKVRDAADAWFAQQGMTVAEPVGGGSMLAHAEAAPVDIADAHEVNEIDLAASPASPPERSFMQSLIVVLGGVFAAAAAGRFLFV